MKIALKLKRRFLNNRLVMGSKIIAISNPKIGGMSCEVDKGIPL